MAIKQTEKIYIAHPQFIGRDVQVGDGGNTNRLYELEEKISRAIHEVMEWRVKYLDEKEWEEALPQTLLTILDGFDQNASEVATRCFINKIEGKELERVEKKVNTKP